MPGCGRSPLRDGGAGIADSTLGGIRLGLGVDAAVVATIAVAVGLGLGLRGRGRPGRDRG